MSRDWSDKLNGYLAIDWSLLWIPYKGQPNKIKVERERYMKHMATALNDPNELIMFYRSILGNFFFETLFCELETDISLLAYSYKQSKFLHSNQISDLNYTLVDSSLTNYCTQLTNHNLWTLYFDSSMNRHGVDVGCLLIDPYGIQTYFSYLLESKCTKIDAEYDALIQGLGKTID